MVSQKNFNRFFFSFVECALWAEVCDSPDTEERDDRSYSDKGYSAEDFDTHTYQTLHKQCESFLETNSALIEESGLAYDIAGHCFWLNRNGHGSGFWDRDIGKAGDALSDASKAAGEVCLYVGDDGKVYAMGMEGQS